MERHSQFETAIDYDTSENSKGKRVLSSNVAEQIKQLTFNFSEDEN